VRCSSCGSFSYLPRWASLPAILSLELALLAGVVLALWYQASWLFLVPLLVPALAGLIATMFCPLSLVRHEKEEMSFRRPSRFS